jgi:hypothetical protein
MLDQENAFITTLNQIRERDGEKFFQETATHWREAIDCATSQRRHRARGKGA